jgi:hypothetical protein
MHTKEDAIELFRQKERALIRELIQAAKDAAKDGRKLPDVEFLGVVRLGVEQYIKAREECIERTIKERDPEQFQYDADIWNAWDAYTEAAEAGDKAAAAELKGRAMELVRKLGWKR